MTGQESSEHRTWERALDEMEAFLRGVADAPTAAGDEKPWTAPDLGPLPLDLADRARGLLVRQQQVLEQLRVAQEAVRHQQAVTERFSRSARRSDGPVYVDHSL